MQRENEMKLCVGAGNSIAYPDEAKRSRNEAAAAIRAAVVTDRDRFIFIKIRESTH